MTSKQGIDVIETGLRAVDTEFGPAAGFGTSLFGDFRRAPYIVILAVIEGGSVARLDAGNTYGIEVWFYAEDGTLFTPFNGLAQIRIENPDGSVLLDWTAMDNRGIGHYLYQWQTPDPTVTTNVVQQGTYVIRVRGQLPSAPNNYLTNRIKRYLEVIR